MSVNVNDNGILRKIAGGTLYADLPIGAEVIYEGSVVPAGYLACDGSTFSQSEYPDLYAVLGSTTLPNRSNYIIRAKYSALPIDYENTVYSLKDRTMNDITSRLDQLTDAIAAQNLEKYGYKIGDYFVGPTANYKYYLADMDTYYGGYNSYAVVNTHHVGVVVDTGTTSKWYTSTDITNVSYAQSTLHTLLTGTVFTNIKADLIALFGGTTGTEHIVANAKLWNKLGTWAWSSSGGTQDQGIAALTELEMYGLRVWSADNYQQGEAVKQLELFRKYRFNEIFGNAPIWLRSISSSSTACGAGNAGDANYGTVTHEFRAAGLILLH